MPLSFFCFTVLPLITINSFLKHTFFFHLKGFLLNPDYCNLKDTAVTALQLITVFLSFSSSIHHTVDHFYYRLHRLR